MKPALQALLISPDKKSRKNILAGKQTVTIREGYREYKPGTAMLCCHIKPWAVMVEIVSVRHCLLKEVTDTEYKAAGYEDRDELLRHLRRYYPQLGPASPVTVIRWKNPQGKLVKEYLERRAKKGRRN